MSTAMTSEQLFGKSLKRANSTKNTVYGMIEYTFSSAYLALRSVEDEESDGRGELRLFQAM